MERVKTGLEPAPDEAFWTQWVADRPDHGRLLKAAFDGVTESWNTPWDVALPRIIWALARQFAHEAKARQKQPGEVHVDTNATVDQVFKRLTEPRLLSDLLLAAAYRRGEAAAVQAFQRRFRGLVHNLVASSVPAGAITEVEGEIWGALWEKLGQYHAMSTLRTWLNVVVRRWCWDRQEKEPPPGPEWTSEEGEQLVDVLAEPGSESSRPVMCVEFANAMDAATRQAMRMLTPQERALLRLRFVHGMPLEDLRHRPEIYTAGEPEQPVYGITRRVQRAGRKLKENTMQALQDAGYGPVECMQMLEECEGMRADLAAALLGQL